MPLDHHGRAIADIIHTCIDKEVPSLTSYLDSRFITTKQLTKVSRVKDSCIKQNAHDDNENGYVDCADLWPDEEYIIEKFFEKSETESETTLQMCDIPYIHNPNMKESKLLANSLVDANDLNLFRSTAVQSIITFRWQLTRKYVLWKLFIPYLFYFATYIAYVTLFFDPSFENVFDPYKTGLDDYIHLSVTVILTILSFYFLINELRQFRRDGFVKYMSEFWNYVEIIPPFMILTVVALDFFPENHVENEQGEIHDANEKKVIYAQYSLQAIANFAMWFKIFYFLRIFRETGYFVNMLLRVVADAKVFGLLYVLITITFWLSFYIMTDKEKSIFWVYLIGMGEFDTEFD